ncbi:MAG: BMP family ABC transporter substrate-binding protein, partial [Caldilineales bacterium]|nr:BMP family ABC transporter substrate-binding protein [Caldilineales bacterium]
QDRGLMIIGVDTDQYVSAPEFSDAWLTSILKNMDKAVFDTVAATMKGEFAGGSDYVGTLSNGGVGLGSFHDFEDKVSDELKAELAELQQAIIDGDVAVK